MFAHGHLGLFLAISTSPDSISCEVLSSGLPNGNWRMTPKSIQCEVEWYKITPGNIGRAELSGRRQYLTIKLFPALNHAGRARHAHQDTPKTNG